MRLFLTTRGRRQDKAPKFVLAHLTLACASLAFGALAVGGWFLAYHQTSVWLAGFLSSLSLVSALVVPATATAFDTARGFAKFRLGFVIAVFMCIDWAGVHQGYLTIERMATETTHASALAEWDAGQQSAQDRVTTAQGKLDALPTSTQICIGFGPQNCATRLEGLAADRAALVADRDAARADLAAIGVKPVRPELFPHGAVAVVTALLQIVLFIGFGALAETTREERDRLRGERRAVESRRKRRRKQPAPVAVVPAPVATPLRTVP
jgi:hypothetical protein